MDINKATDILKKCADERLDEIKTLGRKIYDNPQPGFTEYETAKLAASKLKKLGYDVMTAKDIPYVCAEYNTGKPGPTIAIIGEMDCVLCSEHPDSKENGEIHACGHHVQMADMYGSAAVLKDSGLLDELCGCIKFMGVPAEEHIQQDFRSGLIEQGKLTFSGGKAELVNRGFFDDVDIAYMVHITNGKEKIHISSTSNGCLVKRISYKGKASHAGGAPHKGINALYAANLGMSAVNSIRETFKEEDYIRVHPIITKGGDTVNVIPSEVNIGTYVRGKTMDAIVNANKKTDRAFIGGAVSLGCKVQIEDIPGYFPLNSDKNLMKYAEDAAKAITGDDYTHKAHSTGSTDMGDLSMIMPVIHPYIGGATGGLHSADFKITDEYTAYGTGTTFLALMAYMILSDDAILAKKVIKEFKPHFKTKEDFISYLKGLKKKVLLPKKDVLDY